jgi:signal transduction histidine kinase
MVTVLRTFSRLDEAERKPVDLAHAIEATLVLVRGHALGPLEVDRALESMPPVDCYPGPLNQVLMNVLLNAVQSMPRGGRLEVALRREGEDAVIEVIDAGVGMSPEVAARAFEPFYSSRGGSGLGLSSVRDIVEDRHGGGVSLVSAVGEGTTVTIRLPAGLS